MRGIEQKDQGRVYHQKTRGTARYKQPLSVCKVQLLSITMDQAVLQVEVETARGRGQALRMRSEKVGAEAVNAGVQAWKATNLGFEPQTVHRETGFSLTRKI